MAPRRQRLSQRRTESGKTHPTRAVPAGAEVTTPVLQLQSEVWLDRAEFKDLTRPQVAETVEAVESADADAGAGDLDAHRPFRTTIPLEVVATDVQRRRARSRRFTRFAAAGILALASGAAAVSLITSRGGPSSPATTENPSTPPVAAIPAPELTSPHSQQPTEEPTAAPDQPAANAAPSRTADESTAYTTLTGNRSTGRSQPQATTKVPAAPRRPAISPDAYSAWSRMAELRASHRERHGDFPGQQR